MVSYINIDVSEKPVIAFRVDFFEPEDVGDIFLKLRYLRIILHGVQRYKLKQKYS